MESLPNKYRPKCFAEVVGQQVTVGILSKQIETGTFRNGYLFTGLAGCGKTSVARIMANTLNNGEGEPIEIDAASNNGVDSIRQIINDAKGMSLDSEYKVFILDEAHMITTQGWNTFLKCLEEPPAHTIFIFCTTNPSKVPMTILTRLQRFDFTKVSSKEIVDRLEYICNEELVTSFDSSALYKIASMSNGLMREAISLLEKCLGYSTELSMENVEKVLGGTKLDTLFKLIESILNKRESDVIDIVNSFKQSQNNSLDIIDDILKFLIECVKYQKTKDIRLIALPKEYKDRISLDTRLQEILDRTLKFRCLSNTISSDAILDIMAIDLCRG